MRASILLTLEADKKKYEVNLNLPTSAPTKETPFNFRVSQLAEAQAKPDNVLDVVLGDKNHVYVAVAPPETLLTEIGVGDVVKKLDVIVSEGKYNPQLGKFEDDITPKI